MRRSRRPPGITATARRAAWPAARVGRPFRRWAPLPFETWVLCSRRAPPPTPAPRRAPGPSPCSRRSTSSAVRLRETTFVVVDLETTGGSASAGSSITEIGAVKVRGGEVLGEFQTLVRPSEPIPPFISVLTGITNAMVAGAPRIESALPSFLEFAQGRCWWRTTHRSTSASSSTCRTAGAPLAAVRRPRHREARAPSDHSRRRPELQAVVAGPPLQLLDHDTQPPRPADARATVDVLHGLMERLGNLGVHTLEELSTFSSRVSTAQRKKRHLAEPLPHAPGVYLFRDSRRPGALRRHVEGPALAGPHLLHGQRDALPDGRDGRSRRRRSHGITCTHRARGGDSRAAADRRAQAALQPPVEVP